MERKSYVVTSDYKVPKAKDIPVDFRISLLKDAPNPVGVLSAKDAPATVEKAQKPAYLTKRCLVYNRQKGFKHH